MSEGYQQAEAIRRQQEQTALEQARLAPKPAPEPTLTPEQQAKIREAEYVAQQAAIVIKPAQKSEAAEQAELAMRPYKEAEYAFAQQLASEGSIREAGETKPEYRLNQLNTDIGMIQQYKKDVKNYNDAWSVAVNTIDDNVSVYNKIDRDNSWDQYDWSKYGGKAGYIETVKDQIAYREKLGKEYDSVNADAESFDANKRLGILKVQTDLVKSRISKPEDRKTEYEKYPLKTQADYLEALVDTGVVDVKKITVKRGDPGAVSSSADRFVLAKDYSKLSDKEKNLLVDAGFTFTTVSPKAKDVLIPEGLIVTDLPSIKAFALVGVGTIGATKPTNTLVQDAIDAKIESTLRDLEKKAGWEHGVDFRIYPREPKAITWEQEIARLRHLGLSFGIGAVKTAPITAAAILTGPVGSALIAAGMVGSLAMNAPAAAAYAKAHPEEFAAGILGAIAAGVAVSSVINAYQNGRLSLPKTQQQKIEATLKAKLDAAYKGLDESAYKGTLKQPGASSVEDYGKALTRIYDQMGWEKPAEWFPGIKSDLVGKSAVELAKELGQGGYVGGKLSAVDKMLAAQKILAWEMANPDQLAMMRELVAEIGDMRMVVVSLDYSNIEAILTPVADLIQFVVSKPDVPIVISILTALQKQGLSNEQISEALPILLGTNIKTAASAITRLDDKTLGVIIPSLSMATLTIVIPMLTVKQLDKVTSDLSITQIIEIAPILSPTQLSVVMQDLKVDQIQEVISAVDTETAQHIMNVVPKPEKTKLMILIPTGKKGKVWSDPSTPRNLHYTVKFDYMKAKTRVVTVKAPNYRDAYRKAWYQRGTSEIPIRTETRVIGS